MLRRLALAVLLAAAAGCTRMRFVVDTMPPDDELTETEVMRDEGASSSAPKIAMIDVTGLIIDANRPRILGAGENPVSRFAEALKLASDDDKVRAVIVRINSPGGGVTASDMLYREVLEFKKATGKPVVMLMTDVAASGGYYLACAGDEIIAYPTSITGSIGVIMQTFNFSEGMKKIGIKADAITSGPNKAMGSPFEPMAPEHRALLQQIVDEFYGGFVAVVTESRPALSPANLEWITDGRVITGRRAAEVGVVDRTGDLDAAFQSAKTRAGVRSARLVKYHRPLEYIGSPYAAAPGPQAGMQLNLLQLNVMDDVPGDQPGFYYLWDPAAW